MKSRCFVTLTALLGVALLPAGAVGQQKSLKDQLIGGWILSTRSAPHRTGPKSRPTARTRRALLLRRGRAFLRAVRAR